MKAKFIKETLNENIKIHHHEFQHIKTPEGIIYISSEGILGEHEVLIPWNIVEQLLKQFKK